MGAAEDASEEKEEIDTSRTAAVVIGWELGLSPTKATRRAKLSRKRRSRPRIKIQIVPSSLRFQFVPISGGAEPSVPSVKKPNGIYRRSGVQLCVRICRPALSKRLPASWASSSILIPTDRWLVNRVKEGSAMEGLVFPGDYIVESRLRLNSNLLPSINDIQVILNLVCV